MGGTSIGMNVFLYPKRPPVPNGIGDNSYDMSKHPEWDRLFFKSDHFKHKNIFVGKHSYE